MYCEACWLPEATGANLELFGVKVKELVRQMNVLGVNKYLPELKRCMATAVCKGQMATKGLRRHGVSEHCETLTKIIPCAHHGED